MNRWTAPGPWGPEPGALQFLPRLPEKADDRFLHLGIHLGVPLGIPLDGTPRPGHDDPADRLEPGDLIFSDPARRDLLPPGAERHLTFLRVPRQDLGLPESDLRRLVGTRVRGHEGVGALVSDFLTTLAGETGLRRSRVGERLARNAVDLLAVLALELLGEATGGTADTGDAMPSRIRAFIEEHLTDPDLSPESIALAHHISVRYLHKLFEADGVTVGRWIRLRRLECCRRELGRASNRRLTVAAVAHRWGFTSASHFSRTFREAFGMSPSQWQTVSLTGSDPGPLRQS